MKIQEMLTHLKQTLFTRNDGREGKTGKISSVLLLRYINRRKKVNFNENFERKMEEIIGEMENEIEI